MSELKHNRFQECIHEYPPYILLDWEKLCILEHLSYRIIIKDYSYGKKYFWDDGLKVTLTPEILTPPPLKRFYSPLPISVIQELFLVVS